LQQLQIPIILIRVRFFPTVLNQKEANMSAALSERVSQIKPSATIAVNMKATELRALGHDIINLSVGEPDFDTPDYIKKAAIDAINQGLTKYTAVDGILPLKEAIINKLLKENELSYQSEEIIVSNGVKQALYNLCQAALNPGDEVIIPAPYWVSYPAMVKLAGAKPVIIFTNIDQRFKITAEQLAASITPKTRMVMLNSPSNPSGMAYTQEELSELATVLKQHPNIIIASDDIYEYILWGMPKYISILNVCPELKDHTVVFNGVSKAYAMTGWRIGYAAGPTDLIKAMKKVQFPR
jgi:aspartate aminotransferase